MPLMGKIQGDVTKKCCIEKKIWLKIKFLLCSCPLLSSNSYLKTRFFLNKKIHASEGNILKLVTERNH